MIKVVLFSRGYGNKSPDLCPVKEESILNIFVVYFCYYCYFWFLPAQFISGIISVILPEGLADSLATIIVSKCTYT